MKIDAYLVEKVSKNGKPYVAVEVQITPTVKKMVFLTQAEVELFYLSKNNQSNK